MSEVQDFYDSFADQQAQSGINNRHLSIIRWLEKFGLCRNHKVLELGSGIGTVSELILRFLDNNGRLTVTDISRRSLEMAGERLKKYNSNFQIKLIDFTEESIENEKFNVILLPDVLEHIPLEKHSILFANLSKMLDPRGFIMVHVPDPYYLQWVRENNPDELQIIDQSIYPDNLFHALSANQLRLVYLESYSIYNKQYDYQVMKIISNPSEDSFQIRQDFLEDSWSRRILKKIRYLRRGGK